MVEIGWHWPCLERGEALTQEACPLLPQCRCGRELRILPREVRNQVYEGGNAGLVAWLVGRMSFLGHWLAGWSLTTRRHDLLVGREKHNPAVRRALCVQRATFNALAYRIDRNAQMVGRIFQRPTIRLVVVVVWSVVVVHDNI